MIAIVGIRFKDSGKTYFFDPAGNTDLQQGEMVIVDTARGPEMAKVAHGMRTITPEEVVGELRSVIRRAEPADFERMAKFQSRHDEVLKRCAEKVKAHQLPMNLVKAEYSFDGSRLTFYFTAEQRVDFRALVRDLARTFRSRIELRQIGPRDEAKLLGGIGPCGRLLCCATFLPDYARVSIKMAKDQDLPLNPSKISGVCGRLLCCLSYEHQQYIDMKATMPAKDDWVQTPDGPGDVVSLNVLRQVVMVRLASSGMEAEYTLSQLQEATENVSAVAQSRNKAGITPAAQAHSAVAELNDPDLDELRLLDDDEYSDLEKPASDSSASTVSSALDRDGPDRHQGTQPGTPRQRRQTAPQCSTA
ncbi:MAG: stage 0 sporulation family protein [Chloroflexaceae bacterium]|nr:stage 0 sporulation family protein [Chloroflexaceae bacterium]